MANPKKKPVNGAGLHLFIATGGKPRDYERNKGLNNKTINNLGKKKK